jgi:CheY-like chemotaxis protein
MNAILISDTKIISLLNGLEVDFIDTNSLTISELLCELEERRPSLILINSELILNGSNRIEFKGIEIIKHIRLTPLKSNISNCPIVFMHWMPIEHYIEHSIENLILFSPGIKRIRLPLKASYIDLPEALTKNIGSFLFNADSDNEISEHQFRNEIAISQFEEETETGQTEIKQQPVWYKKLYYKQGYFFEPVPANKTRINQKINILLIDDLADRWKPALLKLMPNATINNCSTTSGAEKLIGEMKRSIIKVRNDFNDFTNKCIELSDQHQELKELKSTLTAQIQIAQGTCTIAKNNLINSENVVIIKTSELHSLLQDLMKENGLLEVLMDFKTENINAQSKQMAEKLAGLITKISNAKEEISIAKTSSNKAELQIEELSKRRKDIDDQLRDSMKGIQIATKNAMELLESLFSNQYDFVLLDMHLSKESESKQPNQMDGFYVLKSMQNAGLEVPVLIFSSTTKKVEKLRENFSFINKRQFIKGLTHTQYLKEIIDQLQLDSLTNRIINIVNEVIAYPKYNKRIYPDYRSPNYQLKTIDLTTRQRIILEFKAIKDSLIAYKNTPNKKQLENVVKNLGNIYEARITVKNYERGQSLQYSANAVLNRIESQEVALYNARNYASHFNSSDHRKRQQYDDWFLQLNLDEVEKHLKTTYNMLMFDRQV